MTRGEVLSRGDDYNVMRLFFCVEAEDVALEGGMGWGAGLEGAGEDGVQEFLNDQEVGTGVEVLCAGPSEVMRFRNH